MQDHAGGRGSGGGQPAPKKLKVHNVGADGRYATSRTNKPICPGFTAGTCTGSAPNHVCPVNPNFVHLCNKCLDWRHGRNACSLTTATPMPPIIALQNKGGKGGKQSGKGKGGKKGKGKGSKWQY